ncbi:unnamed protein product [Rotaria sp. Silwood1]|nr:unnamed protein product [Rotaria sp. Silwood1]CAF3441119.1 unnamed protein product [Rotaria sp. Silwood1]CAF4501768.1 unnamed protein product [Rotaria sp. Silwood1]CAF4555362.1 unnamed protein product [Rotaria sp. Silwood1]CAF4607698.1 unnamed protein product [Rotaria sp. Silwood1]
MPIDIERPAQSHKQPLRRGIHITEHKDYRVNPEPLVLQEADFLLEEFLSPTKLRALTGTDDLANIRELEMIVDTSDTSLGNFGVYLQKLVQLKLSNSVIPRIRDLGTSLSHIRILWMARCCMNDLDGITSLQSLEELYVAYNEISDLSALSMLEHLRLLDLESNLVDDLRQVEFLALCPSLNSLTLEGNPINNHPDYRIEIIQRLPRLQTLDDIPTNRINKISSSIPGEGTMLFQQDWSLIEECIAAGMAPPDDKLACNQVDSRPRSANKSPLNRPTSAAYYRPRSAARSGSVGSIRPPSASMRPNTDPAKSELLDNNEDVVSELTIGPAFQGNLTKILRARKHQQSHVIDIPSVKISEKTKAPSPPPISSSSSSLTMSNNPLMKEINDWKIEHNRKIEERKKLLEPQILRIADDDDLLENDLEVDESDEDNNYEKQINYFPEEESIVYSSNKRNFGLDETFPRENQKWQSTTTPTHSPEKSESRLTTGDTGYRSNSAYSLHHTQSRASSRSSIVDNSNSTADRYRSPMRVNYEPVLASTNVHRSSLSSTTEPPSPTLKGPKSSTKKSLKGLRNDPLPTLPRLPPRKT